MKMRESIFGGGRKINVRYEISFMADLTQEKKEFLELHLEDTLKLLGLEPEALSISLREKPDPLPAVHTKKYEPSLEELLTTLPMRHVEDVKKCFEACKSKSDIAKVIKAAPGYLGTWWAEYDGSYFTIVNRFLDDDIGDYYEEEYWYDYPEDWEEQDEE